MKVIRGNKTIYDNSEYSGVDADTKKALVGGGIAAGTALVGALASKAAAGKQGLAADVKAACGRKPLVGKDKKAKYQKCVNQFTQQQVAQNAPIQNTGEPKQKKEAMNDTVKYSLIGGGVLVLLIGIYFITKKK